MAMRFVMSQPALAPLFVAASLFPLFSETLLPFPSELQCPTEAGGTGDSGSEIAGKALADLRSPSQVGLGVVGSAGFAYHYLANNPDVVIRKRASPDPWNNVKQASARPRSPRA